MPRLTQLDRAAYQAVASERFADAEALFAAKCYAGAYYMAGYAVECALKSCVAKTIRAEQYPPSDAREFYTHDFNKLISLAGLTLPAETRFRNHWAIVSQWDEEQRYILTAEESEERARDIIEAISDAENGVLTWLKNHW